MNVVVNNNQCKSYIRAHRHGSFSEQSTRSFCSSSSSSYFATPTGKYADVNEKSEHNNGELQEFLGEMLACDIPGLLRYRGVVKEHVCKKILGSLRKIPESKWQRVASCDLLKADSYPEETAKILVPLLYQLHCVSKFEICSLQIIRLRPSDFLPQRIEDFVVFDGEGIAYANLGKLPVRYSVRDSRSAAQLKVEFREGDIFSISGEAKCLWTFSVPPLDVPSPDKKLEAPLWEEYRYLLRFVSSRDPYTSKTIFSDSEFYDPSFYKKV
eukprot:Nk52_evm28s242 gene=Nk52_evmTU28s242